MGGLDGLGIASDSTEDDENERKCHCSPGTLYSFTMDDSAKVERYQLVITVGHDFLLGRRKGNRNEEKNVHVSLVTLMRRCISVLHFGRWVRCFDSGEVLQNLVGVLGAFGNDPRVTSAEHDLLAFAKMQFGLARNDVATRFIVACDQRLVFRARLLILPDTHRETLATGQVFLSHLADGSRLRGNLDHG